MSATAEQVGSTAPAEVRSAPGTPTWEVARLFPKQGEWTESAYLALETNALIELKNGCLEFLPMPTVAHQLILQFLFECLNSWVRETGDNRLAMVAALPIRLCTGHFREPDVMLIRKEQIEDANKPPNGLDLAMEIVSPGAENRKRDYEEKLHDYAQAGIPEYWIVDPEQSRIHVHTLPENTSEYVLLGTFGAGDTAVSKLLDGFSVDVTEVFTATEAAS